MNISTIFGVDKLEELVLHIALISQNDTNLGMTKLNKLVWASDFEVFCETGRTITGAPYQKGPFGPIPRAMPIILERLQEEGRLEIKRDKINDMEGERPIAKKRPNLSAFSQQTLESVAQVVAENFNKTGTQMSDYTHSYIAYEVAEMKETIPFGAWLINRRSPTENEKERGSQLAAMLRERRSHAA